MSAMCFVRLFTDRDVRFGEEILVIIDMRAAGEQDVDNCRRAGKAEPLCDDARTASTGILLA